MSVSRTVDAGAEQVGALPAGLEELLSRARGRPTRVRSIRGEPNPFATRATVETITVELDDGEVLKLFAKSRTGGEDHNPDAKPFDREERLYGELLGDDRLVARFYGAMRGAGGRRTTLLEHIDAWNLKYHDLDRWFEVARRLAEFHVRFAQRREALARSRLLLNIDETYVHEWRARAVVAVALRSSELARLLEAETREYCLVAGTLSEPPPTLVHNDLAPKNVLVEPNTDPPRVRFVDWELAGLGPGPLDLVHLAYGLEEGPAGEMRRIYCDGVVDAGLIPPSPAERDRLFSACEAHKTVYRLAFSSRWRLPLDTVAVWVRDVGRLVRAVADSSRARGAGGS